MSEKIVVKDLQKLDPGSELVCLYELEYVKGSLFILCQVLILT